MTTDDLMKSGQIESVASRHHASFSVRKLPAWEAQPGRRPWVRRGHLSGSRSARWAAWSPWGLFPHPRVPDRPPASNGIYRRSLPARPHRAGQVPSCVFL